MADRWRIIIIIITMKIVSIKNDEIESISLHLYDDFIDNIHLQQSLVIFFLCPLFRNQFWKYWLHNSFLCCCCCCREESTTVGNEFIFIGCDCFGLFFLVCIISRWLENQKSKTMQITQYTQQLDCLIFH